MDPFEVSHLSDDSLLLDGKRLVGHGFKTDAMLLTRITEIDHRRLYRREGYASMYSFTIGEWHMSEDAAYKRINVARVAQRFPAALVALAEGRLHMRAVLMLGPHLTTVNVDGLIADATHKSRFEIEELLAQRFPRPDLPERLKPIDGPTPGTGVMKPCTDDASQLAPEQVGLTIPQQTCEEPFAPSGREPAKPIRAEAPAAAHPKITPLAPERFGLQLTLDREAYDLLEVARALEGPRNPTGDILATFKNAFRCYAGELRKRKFAATDRPHRSRPSSSARHIPAAVKRAVRERDGERCAFMSESGRRCQERGRLEFDHIEPVARGGESTAENVRLVCRAHNQYAADRVFGAEFMDHKRQGSGGGRGRASRSPQKGL
jgi:hypothetical protein